MTTCYSLVLGALGKVTEGMVLSACGTLPRGGVVSNGALRGWMGGSTKLTYFLPFTDDYGMAIFAAFIAWSYRELGGTRIGFKTASPMEDAHKLGIG